MSTIVIIFIQSYHAHAQTYNVIHDVSSCEKYYTNMLHGFPYSYSDVPLNIKWMMLGADSAGRMYSEEEIYDYLMHTSMDTLMTARKMVTTINRFNSMMALQLNIESLRDTTGTYKTSFMGIQRCIIRAVKERVTPINDTIEMMLNVAEGGVFRVYVNTLSGRIDSNTYDLDPNPSFNTRVTCADITVLEEFIGHVPIFGNIVEGGVAENRFTIFWTNNMRKEDEFPENYYCDSRPKVDIVQGKEYIIFLGLDYYDTSQGFRWRIYPVNFGSDDGPAMIFEVDNGSVRDPGNYFDLGAKVSYTAFVDNLINMIHYALPR